MRAFFTGMGVASPAGLDVSRLLETMTRPGSCLTPLALFRVPAEMVLPVGQILSFPPHGELPRTHALALEAARQAMQGRRRPPDAVVVGTTTGGILTSESLLAEGVDAAPAYGGHAPGTVAELVARRVGCRGPVLTVSTACASGTTVLILALALVRSGLAGRVLAVGADSLSRLTYFGFSLLKLLDPAGARPLDRDRAGMTVAEAAAAVLIEAGEEPPPGALCELRGGGLSCDAHHVTAPDPEGRGAARAIRNALADAGIEPGRVDYVNLHGTGTRDNDAAEARALREVFGEALPALSSTKGIYGHPLAAAGTLEAVLGALCIREGLVPANTGCSVPDPSLRLAPLPETKRRPVRCVLSNSFGFGGNNACVVLAEPGIQPGPPPGAAACRGFRVLGSACLTGAGNRAETLAALERADQPCRVRVPDEPLARNLDPAAVRRLKRLPRLALALAAAAHQDAGGTPPPGSVFFGTGLGALSETHDFLSRLFKTGQRFSSPTDFVGSLHSSPAGLTALHFGSRGANVTVTGTDDSFEQALFCAALLARDDEGPILCLAADEAHDTLSPLIDRSAGLDSRLCDGGGALILQPVPGSPNHPADIRPLFLGFPGDADHGTEELLAVLRRFGPLEDRFGAVFAGIPGAVRPLAERRLERILQASGFSGPVVDYRLQLGEYATVAAAACVLAGACVKAGGLPPALCRGRPRTLQGKGILLLGLGTKLSAVAVEGQASGA